MFKQKTKLIALCFVFLFSMVASSTLLTTQDAKALYEVPAGQTCDNKSAPERSVDQGVPKYTCEDSTRVAGNAGAGAGNTGTATATANSTSSCAIEGAGIVLCTYLNAVSKMSDALFGILAGFFLEIQPELFNDGSATRDAWEQARNLANVAFVVAFVVLIYSQITGGLMSNYGIKRMLPRLIIAALAVNLSYIICQGLVDASNILGYNIKDALAVVTDKLPPVMGSGSRLNSGGGAISNIIAAVAAVAILAWPVLSLGMAIVTAIVVTMLMIVVALLMRKAIIILLIVISPLAFVAYLLPNTEDLFKKWWKIFWGMLLVFPGFAIAIGMGQLAGGVILNSSIDRGNGPTAAQRACPEGVICAEDGFAVGGESQMYDTGRGQAPATMGLIANGAAVASVVVGLLALKGSLSLIGPGGAAFAKIFEKGTRSTLNDAGGKIKKTYDSTDLGKKRAHDAHHREEAARLGNFHGSAGIGGIAAHPFRALQSKGNQLIRSSSYPDLQGLRSYKDKNALASRQKDASDLANAFDNDPDAMRVWNNAGGDLEVAKAFAADHGIGFGEDRQRAFQALAQEHAHHNAGSFMAANAGMVASGKGNVDDIIRGVLQAAHADPSVSVFGELEKARSGAASKGRADIYAHLESLKKHGYSNAALEGFLGNRDAVAPQGAANNMGGKRYGADEGAMMQAISDIGVGKLHYEGFKADENGSGSESYDKKMLSEAFKSRMTDDNWAGIVKGAASADGKLIRQQFGGQNFEEIILAEARRRSPDKTIKGIQDAINIVENRTSGM